MAIPWFLLWVLWARHHEHRRKFDTKRLLNGVPRSPPCARWAVERPRSPRRWSWNQSDGSAVDPEALPAVTLTTPVRGLGRCYWETYEAMSQDRLLAVAAGVVFYGLLAIFPAITALVSSYGLFAPASAIKDNLLTLANVLPAGGLSIIEEQIARIASEPSGLSIGFAAGLLIALAGAPTPGL